ncbi:MAG: FKBP-type peptidyl-prolyl cis-trans isomerase [Acidimicrobiia bacterium]
MSPSQKPKRKPPALGQSRTQPWVRVVIIVIVVVLGLGSLAVLFFKDDSSNNSKVSAGSGSSSTASSTPAAASAKGKPCVAATGIPAGAPQVPLTVGPPPTALVSKDLQAGSGATVEASSTITVDYIGVSCSTGKVFDTSYGKQPATFPLSGVIPGWQQGLPGMKVGGIRLLGIPADLAYGAQGYPPDIAPDETLWFVVEVKDVQATTTPST